MRNKQTTTMISVDTNSASPIIGMADSDMTIRTVK